MTEISPAPPCPQTDTQTAGSLRYRCDCGRFVSLNQPGTAWYACGEFGEDSRYVCRKCAMRPGFVLQAGNGSTDPRWCGWF